MSKKKSKKSDKSEKSKLNLTQVIISEVTTELRAANFASRVEDYVAQEYYEKDFVQLKKKEWMSIRRITAKYISILAAISNALREGLK